MKSIYILFMLCILGCQTKTTVQEISNPANTPLKAENFKAFNTRFHNDSVYQLNRIKFPLEGKYVDGLEQHSWAKNNWKMHKTPVSQTSPGPEYSHIYEETADTLIIEKLWIENSGSNFERRFKLIDGKWYLVYCMDVNL